MYWICQGSYSHEICSANSLCKIKFATKFHYVKKFEKQNCFLWMFHRPCGGKLDFNFWIHRGKYSSHKLRRKGRVPKRAYFCVLSPLPPINSAKVYMFRKRIYISFRSVRTSYGALDVRSSTHPATFFPSPFFYSSAKNIFSFSKCVPPVPSPPQKNMSHLPIFSCFSFFVFLPLK